MLTKPIPISEARRLGQKAGADRLVIIALDSDGRVSSTSWGETRAKCRALGKWLDGRAMAVGIDIDDWTQDA